MTRKRLGAAAAAGVGVVAAVATAAALGVFSHGGSAAAVGSRADSIKVHGQWTIVVRGRSGRVISTHRFHNDLVTPSSIGYILSGEEVAGTWEIELDGNACPDHNGFDQCILYEPNGDTSGLDSSYSFSKNLTVNVPSGPPNEGTIMLQGSIAPPKAGTISEVMTRLNICPVAYLAQDCANDLPFTDRTLASPISVLAGQSVQVSVNISFS